MCKNSFKNFPKLKSPFSLKESDMGNYVVIRSAKFSKEFATPYILSRVCYDFGTGKLGFMPYNSDKAQFISPENVTGWLLLGDFEYYMSMLEIEN